MKERQILYLQSYTIKILLELVKYKQSTNCNRLSKVQNRKLYLSAMFPPFLPYPNYPFCAVLEFGSICMFMVSRIWGANASVMVTAPLASSFVRWQEQQPQQILADGQVLKVIHLLSTSPFCIQDNFSYTPLLYGRQCYYYKVIDATDLKKYRLV